MSKRPASIHWLATFRAFQNIPHSPIFQFQDMIHIADTKVERRYGDFFIRQIHKFEEVGRLLPILKGVESKEYESFWLN